MRCYYSASRRWPTSARFGLAYGMYRSRHGRVGTTLQNTPKSLVATTVAGLIAFCIIILLGGLLLTRSINQSADQWRAPQGDQRIFASEQEAR